MADEVKTNSEPAPPRFKITNVVRRVNGRVRRIVAPGRRHFKQFVCGKRLLRKQSIWVTPEEMEKHRAQLMEQVREGAIEITTPDGVLIGVDIQGRLTGRKGQEVRLLDDKSPAPPAQPKPVVVVEAPKAEPRPAPPPPPPSNPVKESTPTPPKSDDLTELPNVGAGRARKLEAAGITTFKQIAEMSPGALAKILGAPVTEDQASDICDAASEKEG